jgi:hypothetical protein
MILSANRLATLYHDKTPTLFATLETLSLSHNQIAAWDAINELHFFASLKKLRLNGNPVVAPLAQTVSRLCITLLCSFFLSFPPFNCNLLSVVLFVFALFYFV